MHELAVAQSILDISLRRANEAGAKRITDINLLVGQFSSIMDDSDQFYWDIIAGQTIAYGATLHFNRIPGKMTCSTCRHTFRLTDETLEYPSYSGAMVPITKSEEFRVDSIDVEL